MGGLQHACKGCSNMTFLVSEGAKYAMEKAQRSQVILMKNTGMYSMVRTNSIDSQQLGLPTVELNLSTDCKQKSNTILSQTGRERCDRVRKSRAPNSDFSVFP